MEGALKTEYAVKLCSAAENNEIASVDDNMAQYADLDSKSPESGLTPLMIACGCGHLEFAQWLLSHGADPNHGDTLSGASPLHKACQGGHLQIVKLLVEHGAFIDRQSAATGLTPLMEAVWFKFPHIVEYLLAQNARLSIPTHYGFSLQQHITYELRVNKQPEEQAKIRTIQDLVTQREKQDQSRQRDNPLMEAVINNDLETIDTLLNQGFPVDMRAPYLGNLNDAHTPLLVAARDGHLQAADRLLRAGADVNAVEPTFLAVPLHKATYNGRLEMTKLLLRQPGIHIDYQGPTNGYTPLHDALWHGFEECAALIIEAGAKLDLRGHDGKQPIDLAVQVFGVDSAISTNIRTRMDKP
jgi:ankyrin repeat protein